MHQASSSGTIRPVNGADTAPREPGEAGAAAASAAPSQGLAGLLRLCGAAGVVGGLLFVGWGYIDGPDFPRFLMFATRSMAFIVPLLFSAVICGLCVSRGDGPGRLGWLAMATATYASCRGLVGASMGDATVRGHIEQTGWPLYLGSWLPVAIIGLSLAGIGALRSRSGRPGGLLALITSACGWAYYTTDSGAFLEARWAHVGFGLLFGLGWSMLGVGLLLLARSGQEDR
jgi:hypothetical protein